MEAITEAQTALMKETNHRMDNVRRSLINKYTGKGLEDTELNVDRSMLYTVIQCVYMNNALTPDGLDEILTSILEVITEPFELEVEVPPEEEKC